MRTFIHACLQYRLFVRQNDAASIWESLYWWELRRIPYNLLILATGMACLAAIAAQQTWFVSPEKQFVIEDVRPVAAAILLFALAANICYTFGWTTEVFIKLIWACPTKRFAEISYTIGLAVAFLATVLPTALLLIGISLI